MKNCIARYSRALLFVFVVNHAGVLTVGGELVAWMPCLLTSAFTEERLMRGLESGNFSGAEEQKIRAILKEMQIAQAHNICIKMVDEAAVSFIGAPIMVGERMILISRRFLAVASDLDVRIELARAQELNGTAMRQAVLRDTFLATTALCAATYLWRAGHGALVQKMENMYGMQYLGVKLCEQIGSWGSWAPTRAGLAYWVLVARDDYYTERAELRAQEKIRAIIEAYQTQHQARVDELGNLSECDSATELVDYDSDNTSDSDEEGPERNTLDEKVCENAVALLGARDE